MSKIKSSDSVEMVALLRALGMPDNCRRFVLVAEVGAAVTIEAECFANSEEVGHAAVLAPMVMRRFRIEPIPDHVGIEVPT